jgi:hypothetical protein
MNQAEDIFNDTIDQIVMRLKKARNDWEGDIGNNDKFEELHQAQMEYKKVVVRVQSAFQS